MLDLVMDWGTIASIATAIGVTIGVWELKQASNISQAQFEDSLDQQYRSLSYGIPVDALIGKAVSLDQRQQTRELIYNYLDLCNEQTFLRKKRKIRKDTWIDWCSGIQAHLAKPEFKRVWDEIKNKAPGTFTFLEKLEMEHYKTDPARW